MQKLFWRCHVCNDIHYGLKPPEVCPTCGAKNAFVRSDPSEVGKVQLGGEPIDNEEKVIASWKEFAAAHPSCRLAEDENEVKMLASGVLENMRNRGLKYCPCRITSGNAEKDLLLICPCNFPRQKNWSELGECWCGLFKKR